jgi:hypothetical protein
MSLRLLKIAIALAGIVPVGGGLAGVILGPRMADGMFPGLAGAPFLDSHFRYLSGLLLGIGLIFWRLIPVIATRGETVRILTLVVVAGGLSRLYGAILAGQVSLEILLCLAMELGVTPLICLWQWRVEKRLRRAP